MTEIKSDSESDDSLPPVKPEHSLPSYSEPTPETHAKLSREEEAERALKHTAFTPGTAIIFVAIFLLTILSVMSLQFCADLRESNGRHHRSQTLEIFKLAPSLHQIVTVQSLGDAWRLLPRVEKIKAFETSLQDQSVAGRWLMPSVQSFLTGSLRAGNEQAYTGRDGWLFYRPDVDYVTSPSFLAPSRWKHREQTAGVQPDPIKAIVDFRDKLAARGIELIVMPTPVKPTIDPEMLSPRASQDDAYQNVAFAAFLERLAGKGVKVFDPAPLLMERKKATPGPLYLETDTHWRPDTMELIAQKLAAFMQGPNLAAGRYRLQAREISNLGDIATMLKLPPGQHIFRPQTVQIHQVLEGNSLWRSSKDADVLLLGDSFSNIFSLEAMGWGEAAGFGEQLSYALGRPIDCLLRNSDASFATREMLSHELAKGRDRLAGKKWVVWEFAARELAFGDWKLLDMTVGQQQSATFFSPKPGAQAEVSGIVEAVSTVPRPGTVPYKDHIMTAHLTVLTGDASAAGGEALVYLWSMRENAWTPAARLRPGDKITVRLRCWADVAPQYEKINRSELDNPVLQLEEPVWGEWQARQ